VLVGAREHADEVLVRRAVQARKGQHVVVAHRRRPRAQRTTRTVLTTGCSELTWLRTKVVNSAGVPGVVVTPSSSRRFLLSGRASTSWVAALRRATPSAGIFAGPVRPKKLSRTRRPWLLSTTVGTSGASGGRGAEVTASGLICPVLKNGTKAVMTSMPTGITPEIRSVVIGAPPRQGTCVILLPRSRPTISPAIAA